MGSIELDCPLCCNDTFDSTQSLKYHLLSLIDNILCPACGSRFQTILELAQHLDSECGKTTEKGAANSNEISMVNIKIEAEDYVDEQISNSILAKALLSPHQSHLKHSAFIKTDEQLDNEHDDDLTEDRYLLDEDETEAMDNEGDAADNNEVETIDDAPQIDDVYSCLSCGVNFTSIVDHIQEYHEGEEVVVEMSENDKVEEAQTKTDQELLASLTDGATIISEDGVILAGGDYEDDDEMQSSESQEVLEVGNRVRMPQLLNTIKQEDCVDKDGRLYTRKVVQIEKFWDEEAVKSRVPLVLKYIVDTDGALQKVNSNRHNDIPDDVQILEIFQCSSCSVQFSKREQFNVHICDPEVASEYRCSMCEATFTSSQSLCAHMKIHKSIKHDPTQEPPPSGPFICNVCDTVFPSNKSLRLHRRMHDPIKAKEIDAPVEYGLNGGETSTTKPREMFKCKVCGKSYDKSYEDIHMAYHSGVNHYDCYICNRKFYTHSNLEMHMRVHGNEKGHLCSHCKKGFLTQDSLKTHLKQHCASRPYQCSYCSRRFARPHEKVKHERIHTGEKPHECEICGKTFRVSYCLTLHMRTHSGYRPYVCQHCGKRFKAHSVYNHHLLTHSDVRGYKCPYCPKAFKTGVQLAGHKNSHTKPFSCTHCNRPFASLYAVRAHMETHKRENNLKYNCYLCGASYARAFALRDHIKEVHVDAPQNGNIALDIIEEGMEASSQILAEGEEDISMATLEMGSEMDEEVSVQ